MIPLLIWVNKIQFLLNFLVWLGNLCVIDWDGFKYMRYNIKIKELRDVKYRPYPKKLVLV